MNLTGQWSVSPTALPFPSGKATAVMSGNKVILMGGLRGGTATWTLDMLSATIYPDGSIGRFAPCGVLPEADPNISGPGIDAEYGAWGTRGNVLFTVSGSRLTTCHTTHLSVDGSPGVWSTSLYADCVKNNVSLPGNSGTNFNPGILARNGYIYVVGGSTATSNNVTIDCRAVKLNGDGSLGTWFPVNPVTIWPSAVGFQGLFGGALCEVNGYLVCSGGIDDGGTTQNMVVSAKISADGTLGPWQNAGAMLSTRAYHAAITIGDTALLIGGTAEWRATTFLDCEALRIDAGGMVCGSTACFPFPIPVRSIVNSAVFNNNRIYILGGRTPSGITDQIQVLNVAF